ncbi:MAG: N-glycosylase/DNA lyase [Nanoarchaeota archaeon]|nr:N-glycosylase/DNA lyase [Nanoarchaeota archaeon]
MNLINELKRLKKSEVKSKVESRLKQFQDYSNKDNKEWFSELCFCLLTANSKAATALNIQSELGPAGFCNASEKTVKNCIIKNNHRFHNNKTRFIIEAREYFKIKEWMDSFNDEFTAREWLVNNIKGLGFKEASHFMRNVGYTTLAILDRHILRLLAENGYIKEVPKSLTRKKYLEIEQIMQKLCDELNMSQAELDLYMWYMKTGKVLK